MRSSSTGQAGSTSSRLPARTSSARLSTKGPRTRDRPAQARDRALRARGARGGSPDENAAAIREVFAGGNGGRRAILLNAAGAIAAGGHAEDARGPGDRPSDGGVRRGGRTAGGVDCVSLRHRQPGLGAIAEVSGARRPPATSGRTPILPCSRRGSSARRRRGLDPRRRALRWLLRGSDSCTSGDAAAVARERILLGPSPPRGGSDERSGPVLRDLDDRTTLELMRAAKEPSWTPSSRRTTRGVAAGGAGRCRRDRRQRARPHDLRDRPRRARGLVSRAPRDRVVVASGIVSAPRAPRPISPAPTPSSSARH